MTTDGDQRPYRANPLVRGLFLWAAVMTIITGSLTVIRIITPDPVNLDTAAREQLSTKRIHRFSLDEDNSTYLIDPAGGITLLSMGDTFGGRVSSISINGTIQEGGSFETGEQFTVTLKDAKAVCHISILRIGSNRAWFGYHCD